MWSEVKTLRWRLLPMRQSSKQVMKLCFAFAFCLFWFFFLSRIVCVGVVDLP